jgi:quinol monooxygenase YgiN
MDKTNPSVVVAGYIKVVRKDREAFVEVLQAYVPRVRKKDGCIAYTFAVDVADPNVVRMSEAWRDRQSPETHLTDEVKASHLSLISHPDEITRLILEAAGQQT